jgi:DNA topoisomerase IA
MSLMGLALSKCVHTHTHTHTHTQGKKASEAHHAIFPTEGREIESR